MAEEAKAVDDEPAAASARTDWAGSVPAVALRARVVASSGFSSSKMLAALLPQGAVQVTGVAPAGEVPAVASSSPASAPKSRDASCGR